MAKVTEQLASTGNRLSIICDFSPPRGGDTALLGDVASLDADFISVAYNPGLSVRVNSAMTAVTQQWFHTFYVTIVSTYKKEEGTV